MRSMKNQLSDVVETLIKGVGNTSIKISEQAMGKCLLLGIYEPKISIELLKENMNNLK
ncbi:MAG: cyclic lactone autoinducer peptide [Solirubrobacterales bacterium]